MHKDKNQKQSDASCNSKPCTITVRGKSSRQHRAIDRREFLAGASAAVAAFSIVPRQVMGGTKYVAPSEKINVGYVGAGTQGIRQLMAALPKPELKIVSVCDPNTDSNDYVAWSKNEIRNKIRAFLKKPKWGEGLRGCRCGRQVGREIVESYYAMSTTSGKYKGCSTYTDFRELLENTGDLDAVYVMTPDHLHATIAIAAMNKGKHVIMHKPLSNILYEAKLVADTARNTKAATHMFCSADKETTPLLCEWIWDGAIGHVREVHNWSSRPFWPQGMTGYPRERPPVPDGLDWNLWLGPVPYRPYHPAYTHAVFRGWYDFGAGALGDMGNYSFYQIFRILKLTAPVSVEASRSQYWAIKDHLWKKQENNISFPRASIIHFEFSVREDMPPVSLYWYDGGLQPPKPRELELDHKDMPREGLLFVGDKGKILCGFSGDNPRIIPERQMQAYKKPPERLPRPIDELDQWIRACKGGQPSDASFERVHPFAEAVCLGAIALRVEQKLKWDAENMQFTNSSQANDLIRRKYRKGWEL
ncbi:MAG: Gfo/Idh/MocA family protein [Planctomycetota bacterium]|jgi:predicted dehydrogenase